MRLVRQLAVALSALVLLGVAVAALLPRQWHVERSIVIAAPPERISPFLASPRRWQEWSVWTHALDQKLRNTYEGPESGVGARWRWLGPVMGAGFLEVTQADPRTGVTLAEAIETDHVNATATLRLSPAGAATLLTWTDEGQLPPFGGLFRSSLEAQLGGSLEESLARLKQVVEALPAPPEAG